MQLYDHCMIINLCIQSKNARKKTTATKKTNEFTRDFKNDERANENKKK